MASFNVFVVLSLHVLFLVWSYATQSLHPLSVPQQAIEDEVKATSPLNKFTTLPHHSEQLTKAASVTSARVKTNESKEFSNGKNKAEGIGERNVAIESQKLEKAGKVAVNGNNGGFKKISGFVDNETLWMLGKFLVGTMAKDYSTNDVEERLHQWGLGDTLVKRLGGRDYLLKLVDEELLQVLEKQELSLLEEIFIKVEYWSETYRAQERSTWIEV
ncbi:hypothetical protein V6N13_081672 [Hibiscus sabdariffa]